ncbi:DNA-cytosine methyltransferase [Paraburkholderia caribensis MBA4]|uniref:Cytosine-specific methyltransferase n=1 Tax=Paraburkholderia caribensis MBA4 TaxID=1323664 RepID=A0A0P0RIG3_9BURK|nr:DNA (cytosine-5-)-methyltransferase [Paraburkholderia caribensis]ALL68560.1 DNA-cytosine methyltransferase [Paraburkholderia caribensis MBA4]
MAAQKHQEQRQLNVVELFAGVGGFRLGLEAVHGSPFQITLSNQFEPSRKKQHASDIYRSRWPQGAHINQDIFAVLESATGQQAIRDAQPDVLVGGFPCQDYSVAKPLSASDGLAGKKGVLWWSIAKLLRQRLTDGEPVKYLVLENVDRLISSPASCRGRDFAVILATLHSLGYAAEWRVINAADYGHPQRRRRIFIVAYHNSTQTFKRQQATVDIAGAPWLSKAVLTSAFPCDATNPLDAVDPALTVRADPFDEQLSYRPLSNGKTRFGNCGLMLGGYVRTCNVSVAHISDFSEYCGSAAPATLGDVVRATGPVPSSFYVKPEQEDAWKTAKGAKAILRKKNDFDYIYSEGAMSYPDVLDKPARTIITSEGGSSPSRTKHVIRESGSERIRRLTPEELEALNGFPRGFTALHGVSDVARAMLMGNALVVGLVQRIGEALYRSHLES